MTIESRLAEIRARVDAATEGPWTTFASNDLDWPIVSAGNVTYLGCSPDDGVRAGFEQADAEFIAASRTDLPTLLAAVEVVMELHRPVEVEPSETICAECSTLRGQGETARYFPFTEYPCPTAQALTAALEVQG